MKNTFALSTNVIFLAPQPSKPRATPHPRVPENKITMAESFEPIRSRKAYR